jgi:WD40 repeat protein
VSPSDAEPAKSSQRSPEGRLGLLLLAAALAIVGVVAILLLRGWGPHTGYVWSVAFSPDGRTLATGSDDRTVRLWDIKTHKQLTVLRGHGGPVDGVAFSPNGRTLASTSLDDGTIRLWDVATRRQVGPPLSPAGGAFRVAFSPDGLTLASAGWDHTARLWDVRTHKLEGVLRGQTDHVNSVAFSPHGRVLAADSSNGPVRLWTVGTRRQLRRPLGGVGGFGFNLTGHSGVAFSPDGRLLASAGSGTVRLWDVRRHKLLGVRYLGSASAVNDVAFSPDGRIFASADGDGGHASVQLWDVHTLAEIGVLIDHSDDAWAFESISFSPDGRTLASGGGMGASIKGASTGAIVLWDVRTQRQLGRSLTG